MSEVIEMQLIDEKPLDIAVDFKGEYVSGASGEEYQKGYEDGKKQGFADGYEKGEVDGKQAEYDKFWDAYQDYGNRRGYNAAFQGEYWNDNSYNPKYPIIIGVSGYDIFSSALITDTKVDMDYSLTSNLRLLFSQCNKLKTIRKMIVSEICIFDRTFNNCTSLENITFEGVIAKKIAFTQSSKLTPESVQNIIDHLADLTGQNTQTLDFNSVIVDKLTDEQWLQIGNKNWSVT